MDSLQYFVAILGFGVMEWVYMHLHIRSGKMN